MNAFKRLAIIARLDKPEIAETVRGLIRFLEEHPFPFCLETETAHFTKLTTLPQVEKTQLHLHSDLAIVVGGDGALLHAARDLAPQQLPVLGINRGRLGFLTDIRPDEFDFILPILKGAYQLEARTLLEVTVRHGQKIQKTYGLNDIVLFSKETSHMLEFDIFIDKQLLCHQRADGLIISTPTGSTAYALSAGGPILHPHLNAFAIVPMCAHTLTSRPIAIPDNTQITLELTPDDTVFPCLSCDGHTLLPVNHQSEIQITKSAETLTLIHPKEYDYYATLRQKLHWGHALTD